MDVGAMPGVPEVRAGGEEMPTAGAILTWARGHWPVLLGGEGVVFVAELAAVTIVEAIAQNPCPAP